MINLKSVTSCIMTMLFFVSSVATAGDIYRWVDDKGQTHFGSQPPGGSSHKAERYNVKVQKPGKNAEAYSLPAWKSGDEEAAEGEKPQEQKLSKDERQSNCRQARQYKQSITNNFSRKFVQEDGSIAPLDDAQRKQEIAKANQLIKQYCN